MKADTTTNKLNRRFSNKGIQIICQSMKNVEHLAIREINITQTILIFFLVPITIAIRKMKKNVGKCVT